MAVWWSERLPVGKRRGDEGHMWRATRIPSDHTDMQPLAQVSDQNGPHQKVTQRSLFVPFPVCCFFIFLFKSVS